MTGNREDERGARLPAPTDDVLRFLAFERRSQAAVVGALGLIIAGVLVDSARPLFAHTGMGLAIAVTSCAAAVLLAAATGAVSIHRRRLVAPSGRRVRKFAVRVVGTLVVVAAVLDLVALVAFLRR